RWSLGCPDIVTEVLPDRKVEKTPAEPARSVPARDNANCPETNVSAAKLYHPLLRLFQRPE
ncbi:MAG TPA: hypothetical protein VGF39_13440, partial [Stellaceae bacterium]